MKKYQPSLIAIEGDLGFSKKEVWLYAKLPPLPYEFLDYNAREALADSLNIGLGSLLVSQEKSVDCQMIVTSMPFDEEEWAEKFDSKVSRYDPSPEWPYVLNDMKKYVKWRKFRSREVYLGVKLGNRSDYKNTGVLASLRDISDVLTTAMGVNDPALSDKEIAFWKDRSSAYKNILCHGALQAEEIRAETIARLLKETLWPGMEMDDIPLQDRQDWGTGEISGLAIADVYNNSKSLKISQFRNGETVEGYRATLCFSRFPDEINFPAQEPWIHYSSLLPTPTTIFSRFTIEPARNVQKVVEAKEKDALDQFENSGGTNAPLAIIEQLQVAQELKYTLSRERKPWIFGRHRIVVTGKTQKELERNAQSVMDLYKNIDIEVVWPAGDQLNLLLESQPADRVRSNSYYQRQELGIMAVGMPTGSGKVGDKVVYKDGGEKGWLGNYIGYTNSRVEEPVFMSIHSAISKNFPPGCVITGSPGGGKTFTGLTLTYLMALQDVWTVLIDPKGDAIPMAALPGLEGRVRIFDLKNGNDGMLDPFTLSDKPALQNLLAIEVVELFIGGRLDTKSKNALMDAVKEVAQRPTPSLYDVVEVLSVHRTEEGRGLGSSLSFIRDLDFARLCFSPNRNPNQKPMRAEDGLTIISLKGLDLPATSNRENYTTTNFLAVGIMYLLANYTESLMYSSNEKHPKAVVIDEAWSITSTPQGANMIPRLARMGRSLNTAVMLISQNAADFLNLTNSMPYRLAFGTKDADEITAVVKFLGLEQDENGKPLPGSYKTVERLDRGQCLMRDPDGRIQTVIIDNKWNPEIFKALDTNPDTKTDHSKK